MRFGKVTFASGILAVVTAVAATVAGAPAQAEPYSQIHMMNTAATTYIFTNVNSGRCLEIGNSSTANFAGANQYNCHGLNNQRWTLELVSGTTYQYKIVNVNSHKCLEIGYSSTVNFARANQYDCHGLNNQRWTFSLAGGAINSYLIRNVNSGKCLEIAYSSTVNFAGANQYDCHGLNNQVWRA